MKKHLFDVKNRLLKNIIPVYLLAGFVTIYFGLCLILVYSNIVRTYETLLTYDLCIRNTDLRFHLVSCYKKHFSGLK